MYYRLQTVLENVKSGLDDTSENNLRNLKLLGEDLIRRNQTQINQICESIILFDKVK